MIRTRKHKSKPDTYQVIIRDNDGHPPSYDTFPSKREAKDWEVKEKARRRMETYFPEKANKKRTLGELIDKYITDVLPSKPKNAKDTKRHLIWWKAKLGGQSARIITADIIEKYSRELSEGYTYRGTKRNPATVNRYLASLSVVFTYGFKVCRWLSENPMHQVCKLKESRGRTRFLSLDEFESLMISCEKSRNPYLKTIVVLALSTGMRRGEILGLDWEDIDFEQALVYIKDPKNGRPRYACLELEALGPLHDLFLGRNPSIPFVFPSKKRFGKICIRKAFDEALKRAVIKGFRFHDLRHTFATYARMDGASIFELMIAMGHSTPDTTQKYSHPEESQIRKTSKSVINNLFKKDK
ncbi:site-specific integrase [Chlamydiales bacterium]|nr:site-specific integrase [Chlamydiales bacterium]